MTDAPRPARSRTRRINGLPALIAIALLIVGALFLTLSRDEVRLKPATGSARAMALAAEGGDRPASQPQN